MSLVPLSQDPYHNCRVMDPDGKLMFRCDERKKKWYLDRGLALRISEDEIRLTFKPKGPGHAENSYFLQEFVNRCVVCGAEDGLSRHHILPESYRKHFPRESEENGEWMYDILVLCVDCHLRYEEIASNLKAELLREYNVSPSGGDGPDPSLGLAVRCAAAILRHGHKMPADRRRELEEYFKRASGKNSASLFDLQEVWGQRDRGWKTSPSELLVRKIEDFDTFARRWREHFVHTMRPRFLPEGWAVERKIYGSVVRS